MSRNLHADQDEPTPEKVRLPSGDSFVVANLYKPEGYEEGRRYPAVVVGGSMSSVKEMMGGIYAGELAKRGVLALAIDYRNWGESGGTERAFEDPASKAEDLQAAVRFLNAREDVARAGLLGVCTSGGTVMYGAALEPSVGAVATVAGWFVEPEVAPVLYGGPEPTDQHRQAGRAARAEYERTGEIKTITAYSDSDQTASNVGPMRYYMDESRGGGVPEYDNVFAVMSWEPWLDFDPVAKARQVTAPVMIVHSDGSALPDQARKIASVLGGPVDLQWKEGEHFDFYDRDDKVAESADLVAAHFKRHLAA